MSDEVVLKVTELTLLRKKILSHSQVYLYSPSDQLLSLGIGKDLSNIITHPTTILAHQQHCTGDSN